MTRDRRHRRGFALPGVIFLVALITLLLTAGLSRVRAERQIAEASEAVADAFALAQSGLQNYLGTRTVRPADGDSVRINLPGGYANVIAHLVQNPPDTTLGVMYLVRSTGVVINPAAGPTIQGRRTVAQFAQWQTGYIARPAAMTAPNSMQLRNQYDSVVVSGFDACGAENVIGVRTPNIGGPPAPLMFGDSVDFIEGENKELLAADTRIDWAAVRSGGVIPDYATVQFGDTAYPVVYVNGDLPISTGAPDSSTGLLIVAGKLTVSSAFRFRGVILVGDEGVFEGPDTRIEGLLVTGLNEQLGNVTGATRMGSTNNPNLDFVVTFNSCAVNRAMEAFRGLIPVTNAWLDNWAEY